MPDFCTCGAQLPDDALFCHKCGKPQRETTPEDWEPVPPPVEAAPPPVAAAPPAVVDFRNPLAVRIGFTMAALATLLVWIPLVNYAVAGFAATWFYRRRTGVPLNVAGGVRMGWITGVLMFAISLVVVSAQALVSGGLGQQLQQQLRTLPNGDDPAVRQVLAFFQSPAGLALAVGVSLVLMFVAATGLSMAGGALGARLAGRGDPRP
jgi:hypothetical protein